MFDRRPGARRVVDVHARCATLGQVALDHDRKTAVDERHQFGVIEHRTGHDQPVHVARADEIAVHVVVCAEWLDEDAVLGGPCRRGDATERLGEEGVTGDLFGRLGNHQRQRLTASGGETFGTMVGDVSECLGGVDDTLLGGRGDGRAALVEDERNRRPGHSCPEGDVGAGRSAAWLGQS